MLSALALGGCGGSNEESGEAVTTGEIGVVRDEEFGNVYIDLTIDGFNALDLKKGGENYLRRGGLTDGQIANIEAYIAG